MNTKKIFALSTLSLAAISLSIAFLYTNGMFFGNKGVVSSDNIHTLVFSSQNPVKNGQILSTDGNYFWAKGDSASGVTWNNGNNTFKIATNGYVQTLSGFKGIKKVRVDLVSGSLALYYDYQEPTDLETAMYETGQVFVSSGEYNFPDGLLPKRVRLIATEESVVYKITLYYDCVTDQTDSNLETINEDGFENSFFDAGSIGTYATTSYVTGEGNTCSSSSKRALKLTFKNTTNNYVSFSPEKDVTKKILDKNPDFTKAVVTLKAKFSDNLSSSALAICPIGSSWANPGYLTMNRSSVDDRGWYTYSYSFNNVNFNDKNSIIRFNIKPLGVNSSNKYTSYVLLDEVRYHLENYGTTLQVETLQEGLENLSQDTGWQNTNVTYNRENTFGIASQNSVCLVTGKTSFNNKHKWFVSFAPQEDKHFLQHFSSDYRTGAFEFVYKPVGITNPDTVTFSVFADWDGNDKTATVSCEELRDGWYKFHYDLSQLGLATAGLIRINIGFGSSSDTGKVYIDNVRKIESNREPWSLGLENSSLDEGMSKYSTNTPNYSVLGSDTSYTSMKQVFTTAGGWQNQFAMFFNLDETYSTNTKAGSGTLEAKFKFSDQFSSKKIRLNIVDESWNAMRYKNLIPTDLHNGWYSLSVDLADLYANWTDRSGDASFDPSKSIMKFGFGFEELNDSNFSGRVVYIDDIFYTPENPSSSASDVTIWKANNTETIKIDSEVGSVISSDSPLSFSHGRNGTDSSQLMIKANSDVTSFNFKPGKLTNESGETMSPQCFETLVEKYQYVGADSGERNNTKYGWQGAGYYPDATVPIDKIIAANENNVAQGNQQGLWINCSIPKEQSPGTYTGNSIVEINGVEYAVPTKVKVFNVTLNGTNHSKTCFGSWDDILEKYLSDNSLPELNGSLRLAYYNFISDKHLSPDHLRNYEYTIEGKDDYESFAENFATYIMPNDKVATYTLRLFGNNTYENIYAYLNALVNRNISEYENGNHVNFFNKLMFYINDEPAQPVKLPDDDTESKTQWANVKNTQTNLTNAINDLKSKLNSYPEIQESFVNLTNVLPFNCTYDSISGAEYTYKDWLITKTGKYPNYFNSDYIRTPCPTFNNFDSAAIRSAYHSTFNKVWFYGCVVPNLPYPSYHLDTRLLNSRLLKWMQYDYDVEGEVYFSTHMFAKWVDGEWVQRDIWNDAEVDGKAYGDGALLYPGDRYNIHGPISTCRMENIRNANEDLELFYLFDENIDKYNARTGQELTSARELMGSYFSEMYTDMKPTVSYTSSEFNSARDYFLSQLEYCF